MTKHTSNKFTPADRPRSIQTVLEHKAEHPSQGVAFGSIAVKIDHTVQILLEWE